MAEVLFQAAVYLHLQTIPFPNKSFYSILIICVILRLLDKP